MMSEFELRRRLQALKSERQPDRDLWPGIAAQLQTPSWRPARVPRRVMLPWASVASVALAVVAGVWLASNLADLTAARRGTPHAVAERRPAGAPDGRDEPDGRAMLRAEARAMQASFDGAIAAVTAEGGRGAVPLGHAPELEAAARELDAATAQLDSALAQEPDAAYLVELLKRTHERRLALAKLGVRAT